MVVIVPRYLIDIDYWINGVRNVPFGVKQRIDVPNIMLKVKDERSAWEKLRHVRKVSSRDNPVVHIKFTTEAFSFTAGEGLPPFSTIDIQGNPVVVSPDLTEYTYVKCYPGEETKVIGYHCNKWNNLWVVSMVSTVTLTPPVSGGAVASGRLEREWRWSINTYQRYGFDHPPSPAEAEAFRLAPVDWLQQEARDFWLGSTASDYVLLMGADAIIRVIHAEAWNLCKFNEADLFRLSSKTEFSRTHPIPLQLGLGEAWVNATEPSENNRGILTVGFNNIQNLLEVKDMLSGALFGKEALDNVGELSKLVTKDLTRDEMYAQAEDFIRRGYSMSSMSRTRFWQNLTPRQQRRLKVLYDRRQTQLGQTLDHLPDGLASVLPEGQTALDVSSDSWFSARYQWNTGLSDFEEAYRYFYNQVQIALGTREAYPVLHGKFTDRDGITYRTSFRVRERSLSGLTKLEYESYVYGFDITPAVMWDFVPFSFVVDWFFPVSETLEQFSRNQYYSPQYFEYFDGCCNSVKYTVTSPRGIEQQVYCRWYEPKPLTPDLGYHWVQSGFNQPSDLNLSMRTVDGLFLMLRKV